MEFSWGHTLTEAGIILIPMLLAGYVALRKVLWQMGEYRLHRHIEKQGPLRAEGMIYPRSNGD